MTEQIGVQYQPLSRQIDAGRLNKNRTAFLSKHDVTDNAIGAVIAFVHKNYNGAMITDINGTEWHIQVTEMKGDQNND